MKDTHNLGVIHGNLEIVCAFAYPHFCHALTQIQTKALVDAGHAYIASELVVPQHSRIANAGVTTADKIYSFGVLAWEVVDFLERYSN